MLKESPMPTNRFVSQHGVHRMRHSASCVAAMAGANAAPLHDAIDSEAKVIDLAAVSRTPNNLDLFVIGFDNRVYTTFWR
jgi:hypothetical protein